jgi:peptidoglycan/LPS O-acetylase OafA/YrhL
MGWHSLALSIERTVKHLSPQSRVRELHFRGELVLRVTTPEKFMRERITELDGLRAIAVSLVFLNHFAPIRSAPWLGFIHRLGWVGVDIFFVLSGFLVTAILLNALVDRDHYFRNFYARRSLRIFPLYYLLLTASLFTMSVARHGLALREMQVTWGHPLWLYAYLGNVMTAATNVSPPSYFVPMWSLHVEEQFYLVLPLLVLCLKRSHLKRAMVAAVLLAPAIRLLLAWLLPNFHLLQYMLFPCRMDSFALGGLLAMHGPDRDAMRRRWRWPVLVATVCVLALAVEAFRRGGGTFDGSLERTVGYTLFDIAFLGFIMSILSLRGTAATAWMNWKPLQYLGMISYGLYLFQFPAEGLVNRAARAVGMSAAVSDGTFAKFMAVGATCLVLSTISWYLWETKWLAIKGRLGEARAARPPAPSVAPAV